jgi:hypothetical protein
VILLNCQVSIHLCVVLRPCLGLELPQKVLSFFSVYQHMQHNILEEQRPQFANCVGFSFTSTLCKIVMEILSYRLLLFFPLQCWDRQHQTLASSVVCLQIFLSLASLLHHCMFSNNKGSLLMLSSHLSCGFSIGLLP